MVTQVGMSPLGLVALNTDEKNYSEDVAARIDHQMRTIAKDCYQQALALLSEHRDLMDILVEELIDRESLTGDEFRTIVDRYLNSQSADTKSSQPAVVKASC
jgi:cell division protease FtsH